MVAKQQQLEWLAEEFAVWPGFGGVPIRMSSVTIGEVNNGLGVAHHIRMEEWQQERDKMSSKPEVDNSWHERGELPPVWCECEAFADGCEPEPCTILAINNGAAAVKWSKFNNGGLDVITLNGWSFRPLSTEREKAIEQMAEILVGCEKYAITQNVATAASELLYDAGCRMVKP